MVEAAGIEPGSKLAELPESEVVDENGDELVLCFPSAVDAVNCALAAQAELAGDPEVKLRIGIHLGDVIFEEGRVYGDGGGARGGQHS